MPEKIVDVTFLVTPAVVKSAVVNIVVAYRRNPSLKKAPGMGSMAYIYYM
jgi:hypothetical protein